MKDSRISAVNSSAIGLSSRVAQSAFALCLAILSFSGQGQDLQTIRGLIEPKNKAVMSSEIAAKVIHLPYRSGDAFGMGDTLVEFDCSLYRAQLNAALASKEVKTREFQNAEKLASYKAISPIEVEIARSEMKQAQARYEIENLKVSGCSIKAPYSGRVIDVLTNEYETVNRGAELLAVLSDEQLEIELIVPSNWLGWLRPGDGFEFHIDETNRTYPATISRIGAMVDPISQTVAVVALFNEAHQDVLSGMSGNATFQQPR